MSDSRLYASLSTGGGGLIKHYPTTGPPFINGVIGHDVETGIGADKELIVSSDGNTLCAAIPNAGGGRIKQYDVIDPFSSVGSDFEFGRVQATCTLMKSPGDWSLVLMATWARPKVTHCWPAAWSWPCRPQEPRE